MFIRLFKDGGGKPEAIVSSPGVSRRLMDDIAALYGPGEQTFQAWCDIYPFSFNSAVLGKTVELLAINLGGKGLISPEYSVLHDGWVFEVKSAVDPLRMDTAEQYDADIYNAGHASFQHARNTLDHKQLSDEYALLLARKGAADHYLRQEQLTYKEAMGVQYFRVHLPFECEQRIHSKESKAHDIKGKVLRINLKKKIHEEYVAPEAASPNA